MGKMVRTDHLYRAPLGRRALPAHKVVLALRCICKQSKVMTAILAHLGLLGYGALLVAKALLGLLCILKLTKAIRVIQGRQGRLALQEPQEQQVLKAALAPLFIWKLTKAIKVIQAPQALSV